MYKLSSPAMIRGWPGHASRPGVEGCEKEKRRKEKLLIKGGFYSEDLDV